jgi:hypothetical protein
VLDIKKEVADLQGLYNTRTGYHSFLVMGGSGTGKTTLLETCPRPIHVDSFDPKGTLSISKGIKEGWIIADTSFEQEDPTHPTVFALWDAAYERRKKEGYFEYFGTYAVDGLSRLNDAIMNYILYGAPKGRKADRKDLKTDFLLIPQENDWPLQMAIVNNICSDILTLPCNVVMIGHVEDKKDKKGNLIGRGLFTTGRNMIRIPRLFEEIYITVTRPGSAGPTYWLQTKTEDLLEAKTRIGRDTFDFYERPDIVYLLNKAGQIVQHKEIPWLTNPTKE